MCSVVSGEPTVARSTPPGWLAAVEVGLIFLIFFIHAAWPVPETNEPHYLSKARHYWDARWCAQDFFCNTADAHQVFYWTFGWLTRWLSLAQAAWVGRLLTWGLLAWAWQRLSAALLRGPGYAVLTAGLFLALGDHFQMAGEWVVGGVEAKGFAYALALVGLERLVRGRWSAAILWFGAASSFHVIVGGWCVVSAAVVWLASDDRPKLARLAWPLTVGLLLALPGLLPALLLTWNAPSELVADANQIYVYGRLSHHLDPGSFAPRLVMRNLLLVAALAVLARTSPRGGQWQRLRGFVAAAVGIAAVGMVVGMLVPLEARLAAGLLRYYWFRMSDVMVPLGTALCLAALLQKWQLERPRWFVAGLTIALAVVMGALGECLWRRGSNPRPPADGAIANLEAWREMCRWIAAETPEGAVFLTPRLAQTFRWYADRAEVVSYKDIPQDAEGIVEWWRRLNVIYRDPGDGAIPWRDSLAELGSARLLELGQELGADYVIATPYPALRLPRVGPDNPSFVIYRLKAAPAGSPNE